VYGITPSYVGTIYGIDDHCGLWAGFVHLCVSVRNGVVFWKPGLDRLQRSLGTLSGVDMVFACELQATTSIAGLNSTRIYTICRSRYPRFGCGPGFRVRLDLESSSWQVTRPRPHNPTWSRPVGLALPRTGTARPWLGRGGKREAGSENETS
jgi:hypothetical protein